MKKDFLAIFNKRFINTSTALLGLVFFYHTSNAQEVSIETIAHRVADHVIQNTTYCFIDRKTKNVFRSTAEIPAGTPVKVQSVYNEWEYANGVMMIGMLQASELLKEDAYKEYVNKNFDFIFKNTGYFKDHFDLKSMPEWGRFFRMGSLDDCGAMAAALLDIKKTGNIKEYDEYIRKTADYILNKQIRLEDSTLCRNFPHKMTIWADDLYMSVPFLARMGKLTADMKFFDDAIKQVEHFNRYLYDSTKGVYFHCWYSDIAQNGVAHWLRCNGWMAMAQVDLLNNLPRSHPKRQELIAFLQRQLAGIARYQDQAGLWHQLIDKHDSYLESSGTAMFVYAIAKAVNEKWIPASYKSIAVEGWKGLSKKVTDDGKVEDVCVGTNIEENILFYYKRPRVLNDFHVSGALLLAASEMIKLRDGQSNMHH